MNLPHFSTEERQVAFAICCGMPHQTAADALGIPLTTYMGRVQRIMRLCGFDNRVEFAVNVNAAVRDAFKKRYLQ